MVFKFFGNFRRRFFKQIWWRWNLIFLTKARNIPHDCLKKNNSCFEVNAFIEILNCRIYTTPQKKKKKKKATTKGLYKEAVLNTVFTDCISSFATFKKCAHDLQNKLISDKQMHELSINYWIILALLL